VAGVTIPRGALVYGVLASANRDEAQFAGADRLDVGRQKNRHLAFGQGVHYCLGLGAAPGLLVTARNRTAARAVLERVCT